VTSSPVGAQDDATKKLIANTQHSEQMAAMCKQQVIQLQAQLHFETANNTKLVCLYVCMNILILIQETCIYFILFLYLLLSLCYIKISKTAMPH